MIKFNANDRFFIRERGKYFTLLEYNTYNDSWIAQWGDSRGQIRVYPEELNQLKYFSLTLIQIKDDKHLLELRLKH